jgi:hypothetical protein
MKSGVFEIQLLPPLLQSSASGDRRDRGYRAPATNSPKHNASCTGGGFKSDALVPVAETVRASG